MTTALARSPTATAKFLPNQKMSLKITASSDPTPTSPSTKEPNGSNLSSLVCGIVKVPHSNKLKTGWLEIPQNCGNWDTWGKTLKDKTCSCFGSRSTSPPSSSPSPCFLISLLDFFPRTKMAQRDLTSKTRPWLSFVKTMPSRKLGPLKFTTWKFWSMP